MTTQQCVENIKAIFPDVKRTQIIRDLDAAQKLFAEETAILETRGQLSSISTNVAWSLPSDCVRITDLVFYDSDSKPLYIGDYDYGWQVEFDKIYIYSLTSTPITGLDSGIDTAYIHYKSLPTTLASENTALEIDSQFRGALEHGVLGQYFAKYPTPVMSQGQQIMIRDLNAAKFHLGEYEKIKIKAKRFVGRQTPPGEAKYYGMAGAFTQPRRINDASQGSTTTTQVSALGDLYAKYIAYTCSSSGSPTATETISQIGYSTVSAVLAGNTLTVSSTAEFGNDTQILCNNGQVSWEQNLSSEIVFTFPSGWGTIAIEIYERV